MTVTGSLEIIGAVAVLVPRAALWGAGLLVCVMIGALISHLTHDQAGMTGLPLVLLILALVVAWLRTRMAPLTVIA
jgi:uncharacterized membrane protein YfcA